MQHAKRVKGGVEKLHPFYNHQDMEIHYIERPEMPDFFDHRDPETHKGHYGHALLVAGSYGKMGAAILAARACLRTGVGLLTVHVPRRGVEIMQIAVPEAMVSIDEDEYRWSHRFSAEEIKRYDAIAVGPGLGTESAEPLRTLISVAEHKAMVLDADALNMLAQMDDKMELLRRHAQNAATILTPHDKEYERLFGAEQEGADPLERQSKLSKATGCVIVHKGHRTHISDNHGNIYINTTGNPGMATAGSGDVLTGIIGSILTQNKENQLDAAMCAILGVWTHGKSGDFCLKNQSECSLTASDIVKNLKYVTSERLTD